MREKKGKRRRESCVDVEPDNQIINAGGTTNVTMKIGFSCSAKTKHQQQQCQPKRAIRGKTQ